MFSSRLDRASIAVTIILLLIFLPYLSGSLSDWGPPLVLCLAYILSLWNIPQMTSTRKISVLILLLYAASLVYWFAMDGQSSLIYSLQGILISYIALLLPNRAAVLEGVSIVAATCVSLVWYTGQSWEEVIRQDLFIYVGLFALFRMVRLRRMRTQEQRLYTEELTLMHSELEQTHNKLQEAHKELEMATLKSLHYAVLEERSRIARDLHDSIGHRLTSVIVQLQALPYVINTDTSKSEQIIKTVLEVSRSCLHEVRSVVHDMGEDEAGTGVISLRSLVQQTALSSSMEIHLNIADPVHQEEWPINISVAMYRCLQEALTNTIRHANATQVNISVSQTDDEVYLIYQDNGELTLNSVWQEGFGLTSMRKRCADLGGRCHIKAQMPHGIEINIHLPLEDNRFDHDEKISEVPDR